MVWIPSACSINFGGLARPCYYVPTSASRLNFTAPVAVLFALIPPPPILRYMPLVGYTRANSIRAFLRLSAGRTQITRAWAWSFPWRTCGPRTPADYLCCRRHDEGRCLRKTGRRGGISIIAISCFANSEKSTVLIRRNMERGKYAGLGNFLRKPWIVCRFSRKLADPACCETVRTRHHFLRN